MERRDTVKVFIVLLLLCTLSFGQMPMTKAQKRDCSNAIKATKKNDPKNLSPEEFKALLAAMDRACGTPEDYAAKHQAGVTPEDDTATDNCSNAIEAVNQNVKKNGPDPTLSRLKHCKTTDADRRGKC
jgi:hypothetical protein